MLSFERRRRSRAFDYVTWPVFRRVKKPRDEERQHQEEARRRISSEERNENEPNMLIQENLGQVAPVSSDNSCASNCRLPPEESVQATAGSTDGWSEYDTQALIAALREGISEKYIHEHILPNRSVGAIKWRKSVLRSKGLLEHVV